MIVPLMLISWATVAIKQGLPLYFSRDMRPWQINCTTVCISEIYMPWPSSSLPACRPVAGADEDSHHHLLDLRPTNSKEEISLFNRWDKHKADAKQEVLGLAWSVVNLKFGNVMWCQHNQSVSQHQKMSFQNLSRLC